MLSSLQWLYGVSGLFSGDRKQPSVPWGWREEGHHFIGESMGKQGVGVRWVENHALFGTHYCCERLDYVADILQVHVTRGSSQLSDMHLGVLVVSRTLWTSGRFSPGPAMGSSIVCHEIPYSSQLDVIIWGGSGKLSKLTPLRWAPSTHQSQSSCISSSDPVPIPSELLITPEWSFMPPCLCTCCDYYQNILHQLLCFEDLQNWV